METPSGEKSTQADYDALPDGELFDMGMYRCGCGVAVYPDGSTISHCELDSAHREAKSARVIREL